MTTKHLEKGLPRAGSRGFSLVEVMVYIFILVFMLVVVIEVVVSITRASRVISSARAIENSAVLSIERLTREMRLADSVVVASSTLAVHPGRLALIGEDDEGDPYYTPPEERIDLKPEDCAPMQYDEEFCAKIGATKDRR